MEKSLELAAATMERAGIALEEMRQCREEIESLRKQLEAADRMRDVVYKASYSFRCKPTFRLECEEALRAYDKARNGSTLSGATSAELFETLGMSKDEAESKERGVNAVLRRGKIIADNKEGE